LQTYRGGHAGLEDAVGVLDVDLDAEDLMLAIVAGLDVAGKEFSGRGDLLYVSGELTLAQSVDRDLGGLTDLQPAEVGLGDVDLDPELVGLEHGHHDLVGGYEIAGTNADGFDDGIGRCDEIGLFEASIELLDVGQRLDEAAFSGVDVLTAIAAMHELCGGERFLIAVSSGVGCLRGRVPARSRASFWRADSARWAVPSRWAV
jgi:hypothetical protein